MLPPTQIFHPNPIPPHRSIRYFDFHDKNFFTFLYSFTTTVQTSKQYSLVGPTIEVYISGIIIHAIFISAYFSHYYIYKHLPCCHELLESTPVPSVYSIYVYMNAYLFILLLMDITLNIVTLYSVLIAGDASPPMSHFKRTCLFLENVIFQLI